MNNKTKLINIRVTEEEHTLLCKRAKFFNMNLSKYLRTMGLGTKTIKVLYEYEKTDD